MEITGIGKEKLSSEKLGTLFSIINYRYENMLPTITYTNLKAKELIAAISDGAESGKYRRFCFADRTGQAYSTCEI